LKIPEEKVFINLQKYGNTSTASIPLALCEAIEEGRVNPGDNIVFVGFGAGLTWAAAAIKWSVPVEARKAGWWKQTRRQATYQAAAARSMWRRAVRWAQAVLPTDPEGRPVRTDDSQKAPEKVDDNENEIEPETMTGADAEKESK
jgi:3-oxoacyl-[acyl-carrier-protein] synthase-3